MSDRGTSSSMGGAIRLLIGVVVRPFVAVILVGTILGVLHRWYVIANVRGWCMSVQAGDSKASVNASLRETSFGIIESKETGTVLVRSRTITGRALCRVSLENDRVTRAEFENY